MADHQNSDSDGLQDHKGDRQTYLYHKQEVQRRRVPPDFRPTGGARKGPAKNLAQETLMRNLRIFALAAVLMLVFVMIAIFVAKQGWRIKNRNMEKSRPAHVVAAHSRALEAEAAVRSDVVSEADTELLEEGPSLDTSALRKAVFLGKRGKNLATAGDLEGALELYMEALDIWPQLVQVWADLGQVYLVQRKYAKAEVALAKAVEQDPANPQTLNDLGVAYLYLNQLDKAEELFNATAEIDQNFADSYFNMALCKLARGDKVAARDYFERYLRMKPGNAQVLKELAYLDASDGNYARAMERLRLAMEERPDWPILYYDAAAACALQGQLENTFEYLEKAMELTSPQVAYRVYQQPAFKELRTTELGHDFEKTLADQTRELLSSQSESDVVVEEVMVENAQTAQPLSSVTTVSAEETEANETGD